MPSQFSTIGFSITSGEDLAALASEVADKADRISTPPGEYLKWAPPSGEQLWRTRPFSGLSSAVVTLQTQLNRSSEPGESDWTLDEQTYTAAVREYSHRLAEGR